jgi:2-C-methyl-D-erythritol 4-phosphate cytidylyltransferase
MGVPTPKAFLDVGGSPMAVYSLRTLSRVTGLTTIVLVIGADQEARATDIVDQYGPWPVPTKLVCGGAERQDSVAAGLEVVEAETDLVLVHDAARPFVSLTCVQSCIDTAGMHGAAIAAVAAHDTVKRVNSNCVIVETLDRTQIWLAQTPQVFRAALLREAYRQALRDGYVGTDDAALVERLAHPIHIVPGEPTNRKITTPDDLCWAEWYLQTHPTPESSNLTDG